jgi:choline kinase
LLGINLDCTVDNVKALILAAGAGSRLSPLTDVRPKCMVEVSGQAMLLRCLSQLEAAGVDRAAIAVGYLEQVIRDAIGDRFGRMRVEYVSNPDYATTNNLYTLFLTKPVIDDDILLVEGDLLFDDALFPTLLATSDPEVAVVDAFGPGMDGTVILETAPRRAERFVLKRDQGAGFDYSSAWKTVNVYKLSRDFMHGSFFPEAARWIAEERTDQYYEAVIAALVERGAPMSLLRMESMRWAEVDDTTDLARAERIFPR